MKLQKRFFFPLEDQGTSLLLPSISFSRAESLINILRFFFSFTTTRRVSKRSTESWARDLRIKSWDYINIHLCFLLSLKCNWKERNVCLSLFNFTANHHFKGINSFGDSHVSSSSPEVQIQSIHFKVKRKAMYIICCAHHLFTFLFFQIFLFTRFLFLFISRLVKRKK